MDIRYCNELELPSIIAQIGQEARQKKLKINVIPQFVGSSPIVYSFGTYENNFKYFHTIILRPLPLPQEQAQLLTNF